MIELATITVTAQWPMEVDGLFMGYTGRKTMRFRLTDEGIVRKGKLYKTSDIHHLLELLGAQNPKVSFSVSKHVKESVKGNPKAPRVVIEYYNEHTEKMRYSIGEYRYQAKGIPRGFYEKANGLVEKHRYGRAIKLLRGIPPSQIKKLNPEPWKPPLERKGRCFELAGRFVLTQKRGILVHGKVTEKKTGTIRHAWVEIDGYVYDPVTGDVLLQDKYYKKMKAKPLAKYTVDEAIEKMASSRHYGPWGEGNPGKWVGERKSKYKVKPLKKAPWKMTVDEFHDAVEAHHYQGQSCHSPFEIPVSILRSPGFVAHEPGTFIGIRTAELESRKPQYVAELKEDMKKHGLRCAVSLDYRPERGKLEVLEGTHRIMIAEQLGWPTIRVQWVPRAISSHVRGYMTPAQAWYVRWALSHDKKVPAKVLREYNRALQEYYTNPGGEMNLADHAANCAMNQFGANPKGAAVKVKNIEITQEHLGHDGTYDRFRITLTNTKTGKQIIYDEVGVYKSYNIPFFKHIFLSEFWHSREWGEPLTELHLLSYIYEHLQDATETEKYREAVEERKKQRKKFNRLGIRNIKKFKRAVWERMYHLLQVESFGMPISEFGKNPKSRKEKWAIIEQDPSGMYTGYYMERGKRIAVTTQPTFEEAVKAVTDAGYKTQYETLSGKRYRKSNPLTTKEFYKRIAMVEAHKDRASTLLASGEPHLAEEEAYQGLGMLQNIESEAKAVIERHTEKRMIVQKLRGILNKMIGHADEKQGRPAPNPENYNVRETPFYLSQTFVAYDRPRWDRKHQHPHYRIFVTYMGKTKSFDYWGSIRDFQEKKNVLSIMEAVEAFVNIIETVIYGKMALEDYAFELGFPTIEAARPSWKQSQKYAAKWDAFGYTEDLYDLVNEIREEYDL